MAGLNENSGGMGILPAPTITVSGTEPANPKEGDIWIDSTP